MLSRIRRVRAVLPAAALFALLSASPAAAITENISAFGEDGVTPNEIEAHFNDLTPAAHADTDPAIQQHLVNLIDSVPAHGRIRGGIYDIERESPVLAALQRAKARLVELNIVQYIGSRPNLRKILGGESVRRCARHEENHPSACTGDDSSGRMHSKYFTFSLTKNSAGAQRWWTTWIGSYNPVIEGDSGDAAFNNSITIYDDEAFYNRFRDIIWWQMWDWANLGPEEESPRWGGDFLNTSTGRGVFSSPKSNVRGYASPDTDGDILASGLANFDGGDGCRVRVAQLLIRSRPDVIDQLIRAKQALNCTVDVLVDWYDERNRARIGVAELNRLQGAGIRIKASRFEDLHDKIVILTGTYGGNASNRFNTFTGSHNISYSALRENDELLVHLRTNQRAHDAYVRHFDRAWAAAKGDYLCAGSRSVLASENTGCAQTG